MRAKRRLPAEDADIFISHVSARNRPSDVVATMRCNGPECSRNYATGRKVRVALRNWAIRVHGYVVRPLPISALHQHGAPIRS